MGGQIGCVTRKLRPNIRKKPDGEPDKRSDRRVGRVHYAFYIRPDAIDVVRSLAKERGISHGALMEVLVEAFRDVPVEAGVRTAMHELCQRLEQRPAEVLKAMLLEFGSKRGFDLTRHFRQEGPV